MAFKPGWKEGTYEFKVTNITLLEMVKEKLTKQLDLHLDVAALTEDVVSFFVNNAKEHNNGATTLRFHLYAPDQQKLSLQTVGKGIKMNEELTNYLYNAPFIEVKVVTQENN